MIIIIWNTKCFGLALIKLGMLFSKRTWTGIALSKRIFPKSENFSI